MANDSDDLVLEPEEAVVSEQDKTPTPTPTPKPKPEAETPEVPTTQAEPSEQREFADEDIKNLLAKAKDQARANAAALQAKDKEIHETKGKLASEIEGRFRAEESAVAQALAGSTAEINGFKTALATAHEQQNYDNVADLTVKISEAQLRKREAETYGQQLAVTKRQMEQQARAQAADPLQGYPQSARDWIAAHPKINTDPKYAKKAYGLAQLAEAEGLAPYSQDYFDYIDERIEVSARSNNGHKGNGADHDEGEDDPADARTQPSRARRASELPVTRQARSAPPRRDGVVSLTPEERQGADIAMGNNVTKEERQAFYQAYAKERDRINAEGA